VDGFQFEGRQQTANALNRQYPALSKGRWQTVLERGCKTLPEAMAESARMDYAAQAARVMAGRKAARNSASRVTVVPRSREWVS
jgi:hypothetical protein